MASASKRSGKTVFLTEEEAERIQNTVKTRLQKCSEVAGQAREPRDVRGAISQATGASLMADMGGASRDTLAALSVGQPYAPCALPADELQPMTLADLKMETHHHGRRLEVRRSSPVVTLAARSWTMVQDKDGEEIERLELCLHKIRHNEEVLESSKNFIIKDPYFTLTEDGEPTIRVDHPSDLIVCPDDAGKDDEDPVAAEKRARKCKDKGNAELQKKDFPLAHAHYSEGIAIAKRPAVSSISPDLARDMYRNRAHVNLLLDQLDEAKSDALASLIGSEDERSQELDSKAYYRAGCAAYRLGEYEEAKGFFTSQQKLAPAGKDIALNLRKLDARRREVGTGAYNFAKIKSSLSVARSRVDAADFIANTRIEDSPGKGRGLFATRDIASGELIMVEKAFRVVWGHEEMAMTAMTYDVRDEQIRLSPVGLAKGAVQSLLDNPSLIPKFTHLYGDYSGDSKTPTTTTDGPVVDVFRVHDIVARNTFGAGYQFGEEDSSPSTGVWIRSAYINHSCVPNAAKDCVGDLLVIRAIAPIRAGAELFHSYDQNVDYDTRQAALKLTWGFECTCELCVAEEADDPEVRKKRFELVGQADAFLASREASGSVGKPKRLIVAKAQRLKKAIDETYDEKRYKDLPRLAAQRIEQWLASAV